MSYSALVVQVLISSPSDLPDDHRGVIHRSLRVWNLTHGRIYGIHFSPTDWHEGGTPAFGEYPQQVLNDQIVTDSDVGIAVFTDRVGSPTPTHESGTMEEIERLLADGKDVAVLRNDCPRTPPRGVQAAEQRAALESLMRDLESRAFMASYESTERLREVTDSLLTRLASKYRSESERALVTSSDSSTLDPRLSGQFVQRPTGGIWPRVEVTSSVEADRTGRLRSKRQWYLVLESTLDTPAYEVSFRYVDGEGAPLGDFDLMGDRHGVVDVMPPRGKVQFPILQSLQSPSSAMCVVDWQDADGEAHTTRASVRTH